MMQTMASVSCSSEATSDGMSGEQDFMGFSAARRSSRRRTFRKSNDMDLARMLGGKPSDPATDTRSSHLVKEIKEEDMECEDLGYTDLTSNWNTADPLPNLHGPASNLFYPDCFESTTCYQTGLFEEDFFTTDQPLLDSSNDIFSFYADGADTGNLEGTFESHMPMMTSDDTPEPEASSPCSATCNSYIPIPALSKKSVLVAKILTKSDAHAKRIILPRVAVEANLSMLLHEPTFIVTAKDTDGKLWKFVVKSWSNGHNPKPVYVMEQVADYLRAHDLGIGDAVGILIDEDGLLIEHNTAHVRSAAERPTYCGFTNEQVASILAKQHPQSQTGPSHAINIPKAASAKVDYHARSYQASSAASSCDTFTAHMGGVLMCMRTQGCSRPAGHQGWCSGHKGFKRRKASAWASESR